MSGLPGSNDKERLDHLVAKTHKEQAVWFLNAFWEDFASNEAEKLWSFVLKAVELDEAKRAEGSDLDEFQAHRFLEHFKETLTVQAMRDRLRSTGAIVGTPKRVPLTHILTFKYNADWHVLVNAPQGSKEEIEKAERIFREVSAAFEASEARDREASEALRAATAQEAEAKRRETEATRAADEAKTREAEAKHAEAEAKSREADARAREEELQAAKAELEAALGELKAQEDAFNGRTAELTRQSEEGSIVQKNRAKNELAQHLSSDPLPLRRAKITQEAAVKKADRAAQAAKEAANQASAARTEAEQAARQASQARAAAEEAARQASQARASAEAARARSEEAKAAAEAALEEAKRRLEEAEAYLEEAKKRLPLGATWWLERELHERRSYLPKSKGGFNPRE
jgi:chromosome segregation ATPase